VGVDLYSPFTFAHVTAMKLCIAGKNLIAVQVLAACGQRHDVLCLPNSDDDGRDGWQPSLRRVASQLDVPVVALEDIYPQEELCFLSLEYDRIIRPGRFATDRLFNVHFSLLPKYRGCFTSIWPILHGEQTHGVTLHLIDAGVDTGPIIDQRSFDLAGMTAFDAYMRCQMEGVQLALDWVDALLEGKYRAVAQGPGTTFPRKALDLAWRELDLTQSTEQVLRRFRAFTFPVYQRPTLDGREIDAAEAGEIPGWDMYPTADGMVSVRFCDRERPRLVHGSGS
jgi:methionyl-tRNA formyltransferase